MTRRLSHFPLGPNRLTLAEDIEYETVREDWNVYQLRDGTVVKVKLIVQKISRALDDDEQSVRYTPDGEPMYSVRHQVSVVSEVPEELLRKNP